MFGELPAKITVNTPYIYTVVASPNNITCCCSKSGHHTYVAFIRQRGKFCWYLPSACTGCRLGCGHWAVETLCRDPGRWWRDQEEARPSHLQHGTRTAGYLSRQVGYMLHGCAWIIVWEACVTTLSFTQDCLALFLLRSPGNLKISTAYATHMQVCSSRTYGMPECLNVKRSPNFHNYVTHSSVLECLL